MELFSPGHLIPLLIVVAVLFFGWKQLPDMSRSIGRSLRIFKTEMKGMGEDSDSKSEPEQAAAPKALPKAEIVRPTERPRPRPVPHRSGSSTD